MTKQITLDNLPFCIGVRNQPFNPKGIPSEFPLTITLNNKLNRLEQVPNKELNTFLDNAYSIGNEIGTPSNDTSLGMPYVNDFIKFINAFKQPKGRLLEIGAGTGFLSKCLKDIGWETVSIEPGKGYEESWKRHNVQVINDFFPSEEIEPGFDAIVMYTVLEHIYDTKKILNQIRNYLNPKGCLYLSVPDCEAEINAVDLSILLHEHFHYFDAISLKNTLLESGFIPFIKKSKFGRSLYLKASLNQKNDFSKKDKNTSAKYYLKNVLQKRLKFGDQIKEISKSNSLGIFCPTRILNYLPKEIDISFYDDDHALKNNFYPPFTTIIQGRDELIENPPEYLLIASRTFGEKIKNSLMQSNLKSKIILISDILD